MKKNQKGVALLFAIFTVTILSYLASEVAYQTSIEFAVNSKAANQVKAYYAAKSGLDLSLFRIKLYRQIKNQYGQSLPPQVQNYLEMIWKFPFAWPPPIVDGMDGVSADQMQDTVKDSLMEASYRVDIIDEGSKIDINDLSSPVKPIQEMTKLMLLGLFENKKQSDEEWARANQDLRPEVILNNIADWIDPDRESRNGGDERSLYSNINDLPEIFPPNRGFRTLDEIKLVAGMTPEIFSLLRESITVYGVKSFNPNTASSDLLKALSPFMTSEIISEVITRREQTPFVDKNDFFSFLDQKGARVDPSLAASLIVSTSATTNFRITSIGEYLGSTRVIEAIVFDIDSSAANMSSAFKASQNPTDPNAGKSSPGPKTLPKGPPRIVYLYEK